MKESVIYQDIWQQSRKQEALSLIFRLRGSSSNREKSAVKQ